MRIRLNAPVHFESAWMAKGKRLSWPAGTDGHIFPGITIAPRRKNKASRGDCVAGDALRHSAQTLANAGYPIEVVTMAGDAQRD
jgi:hypothetical protein